MYVVIPPDHAERGVVPICISDVDYEGRTVVTGWIEAVKPIADPLRRMATVITGDVHNVSQVTEEAVHSLSARHGENLGRKPSSRVFASARWRARDLIMGGARGRKGLEVEFQGNRGRMFIDRPRLCRSSGECGHRLEIESKSARIGPLGPRNDDRLVSLRRGRPDSVRFRRPAQFPGAKHAFSATLSWNQKSGCQPVSLVLTMA